MAKFIGEYPENWGEIAEAVKEKAGRRCVRCGSPSVRGRVLTVHHFDNNKSNCAWWNLGALDQVCHLQIQGKVHLEQDYLFEHSSWFKPYAAGYYAHRLGMREDETFVRAHVNKYLKLGQPHLYGDKK